MKALPAPGTAGDVGSTFKTVYVYGLNGKLLAELGPSGQVKQEYIYMNDALLATIVLRLILKGDTVGFLLPLPTCVAGGDTQSRTSRREV